jgi:hypothetical protein
MPRSLLFFLLMLFTKASAQNAWENIFIKTDISTRNCYVGEPVVVTFTLYSVAPAIASGQRSPAFYGFSIIDLVNYKEPHPGVAEWKGKIYATSLLRKVLLYPVQAGKLVIDPMYVETVVEVFDPVQNGKTEAEKEIISEPVEVTVKTLPGKKPADFTGAVGRFYLKSELKPSTFPLNQQARYQVILEGRGNFINTAPPKLSWPSGVESFEPLIKENFITTDSGTQGTRLYEFAFTVDSSRNYSMPPISFSYFDLAAKKFITLRTEPVSFDVGSPVTINEKIIASGKKNSPLVLTVLIVLLTGAAFFVLLSANKKRKIVTVSASPAPKFHNPLNREAMNVMGDLQLATALLQAINQYVIQFQPHLTKDQIKVARNIRDEIQLMTYANAIDRAKLDNLSDRVFLLYESGHSAYL